MNTQVRKFLSRLDIDRAAKSSKFIQREPKKINAEDFIVSFMLIFCKSNFSFRQWACQLSLLTKQKVSFQGLCKKCNLRCLEFVKLLLFQAIQDQLQSTLAPSSFTDQFRSVLIEDSTCFKLSNSMLKSYSGAGNRNSNVAMCKSHFCYDLLTMNTLSYKVTRINENDASQSGNILEYLQANDLVLRDMGYLSNKILKQIGEKGAFYITKMKDNYKYYELENDCEFDLVKALNKASRAGQNTFVKTLIIGKRSRLKATLIAVKLTPDQIAKRTKKYSKKNGKNKQMSKAKKQLLAWSIIATNIDPEKIEVEQIFKLYALRWQIELLFKTWKSRFGIDSILNKYTGNDPNKILMLFYLSLLFCTTIFRPLVVEYKKIMKDEFDKELSIQKFASMVINHLEDICKKSELAYYLVKSQACHDQCHNKREHQRIIGDFQIVLS